MTKMLKLSEASELSGIRVETLRLLVADGLLAEAGRSKNGHPYLSADAPPTWAQCRQLVLKRRDHHIERAARLLKRIGVEIEAVSNDLAEAREHPGQPLGVDLTSASSFMHSETSALAAALHQLDFVRLEIIRYYRALAEFLADDRM